ncbi:SusC/RagA family TonB-linked outer membrane protein [Pseudocnuella soli]|uniref:SusC/RagA family TonB-linked outer membrane protein n=1 Tax=Pseudocnuella soli TaxID=2502779 RepID=UPI00104A74F6|nr:TonB-dependent receptor [Pseudocnuella soli]
MSIKTTILCMVLFLFAPPILWAQGIAVTGKITTQAGEPAAGATVTVKGTTTAISADGDGVYRITVPSVNSVLVFTLVGMQPVEQVAGASGTVNVVLQGSTAGTLNEVVVVGYGTQKITKVSGSISTVRSADIEKMVPVRAEEALQGRAAGVNVIQSGSPGSKPTVLIRGIPSFSGTDPVVIVDGVPQSLTDFNSINPSDIESINVLKDAATTAIYGVKGGNGVIVVTTKGGRRNQKTDISINTNFGVQEVINHIGVLNATEYAAIINEGSTLAGGNIVFPNLSGIGVGTDWQKEVFKNATFQSHNISARGGSDKVGYFLSAGYINQGGVVGGNDKSFFNRGNFTANIDFAIAPKLKFILNTTGVLIESKGVQENSFNSIIGSALNFDPTVGIYNTDASMVGKYGYSNLLLSEIFNPLTKLDNTYNKNIGNKLYGKFELQYDVLKNLKLTSRFGYTKYDANSKSFTPLVFYGPNNVENTMDAAGNQITGKFNSVSHEKSSNFNFTWETFGNYNVTINSDHNIDAVLGMSMAKTSGNAAGASRQDVPFNSWEFADFTAATGTNTSTNSNALAGYYYQYFRRNLSYFSRINYDYRNRYLASFTARRDGSYAFGIENKFANFFSGSLGWVISSEEFFNSNFIDHLKLRGSYGSIGNENVNPQFVGIETGGPSYGPTANSNGYTFDNVFFPGSTVGSAANNALRWEKQVQSNIGVDLTFYKRKFSLTADYFQKSVDGLLFTPSASLYLGTVPIPTANIGSTKSSGVDLTLGYNETLGKAVKLNTSLTFTTAKNKVTATNSDGTARILGGSYFNGQSQTVTVFEKGYAPGYFYGYKTDGLFQSTEDISKAATQTGAVPGDIRFVDLNNDGVINAQDQTNIGNPFPDFTAGWNLNLSYKNFDFTAFTYASVGNDIYRAYERNANYTNKPRTVLGRWTGAGTTNDARFPRYSFTDANNNSRVSDRYVEDGSFVKIKNLQLGYNVPKSVTGRIFSGVRVYVQVKNAFTFTKYTGYDPEIAGGILDTGVDRGAYPQARTYGAGLDIKL